MDKQKLTAEHFYKFFQCPHWIWYDIYEDVDGNPTCLDPRYATMLRGLKAVRLSPPLADLKWNARGWATSDNVCRSLLCPLAGVDKTGAVVVIVQPRGP